LIEINKRLKNKILEVFFKADKVIGVSSRVRNIILKYCNEPKRITYINDGIPESQIKEFKDSPQDDNKIKIISVGYLEKRKGHEFVIRAVANLIKEGFEPEYNIIGEGENFSSLKELVRQLDLFDRVKFLGLKTQDEVYRYLSQADIFCLPSWDEAFGVVYLEAMAARLPVIACKAQGIEDVIQDGINGLLAEPKDADSVEKLLKKLIENPQLRKDIAEKARLTVLNQFTWRTNVQKNIAVYAEILP
jgi:glycosyltransferase involved in cell wall biosynthesis